MARHIEDQELLEDIKETADQIDGYLTAQKYTSKGEYSSKTAYERFGGWQEALKEAGVETTHQNRRYIRADKVEKEDVLEDIKDVADTVDDHLSANEYTERGEYSQYVIRDKFGSWNDAREAAGLETHKNKVEASREEVIEDIQQVAESVDEFLTLSLYKKEGNYPLSTIKQRFGSWNEAKEAAGLPTSSRGPHSRMFTGEEVEANLMFQRLERIRDELEALRQYDLASKSNTRVPIREAKKTISKIESRINRRMAETT